MEGNPSYKATEAKQITDEEIHMYIIVPMSPWHILNAQSEQDCLYICGWTFSSHTPLSTHIA